MSVVAGRRPGHLRRQVTAVSVNLAGLLVFAVLIFPVYWMVTTAIKPGRDILSLTPVWVPLSISLQNFADQLHKPDFWSAVATSLGVAVFTVAITLAASFLAAVGAARFQFLGRRLFLLVIISVQMVPPIALIIPIFLGLDSVELTDNLVPLVFVYTALIMPFVVWTLRGFVMNIPIDLEEAAMIDGCTRVGAFVRILLPLVAPGLVATAVYAFIQTWNEVPIAYVLLRSQSRYTVSLWLGTFITQHGVDWGGLTAAATLTALPVVIFFMFMQRYVVSGLAAGGVKG